MVTVEAAGCGAVYLPDVQSTHAERKLDGHNIRTPVSVKKSQTQPKTR